MSKYDCPYLDCDDMLHMTRCMKKRVQREFLEDEFEKAGFKHPWVASYFSSSCTECDEAKTVELHGKVRAEKDYDELEHDLMTAFKSNPLSESQLRNEYLKLKRKMIATRLEAVENDVKSLRELIYEDDNEQTAEE